jgi:hypothetical protein
MISKKFVFAVAIFGGVLFTAQATDLINLDGQTKTEIRKQKKKLFPGC